MNFFKKITNALAVVTTVLATMAMPVCAGPQILPVPLTASAIQRATALTSQAYNLNSGSLPHWRKDLSSVIAGTGYASIAIIGDSTTAGAGAGSGGTAAINGARINSITAQLKKLFISIGVPAVDESTWGDNTVPGAGTAGITAYDPRVTFAGSSWARFGTGLADLEFYETGATANALTFTPSTPVDTCNIYHTQTSGQSSSINITDASGTLLNFSALGSAALGKKTITRTLGSNAISLTRVDTSGVIYVQGFDCYNSAIKSVRIFNWGQYGRTAANFPSQGSALPWYPLRAVQTVAPSVVVINLGINDVRTGVSAATYKANMQAIITAAKVNSDVILLRYHPDNAPGNPSLQPAYYAAQIALADSNNIPLIDLTARYGSYASASSEYYDSVHLLPVGYADNAMALFGVLRPQ